MEDNRDTDNIFTANLPAGGNPNAIILNTSWSENSIQFKVIDVYNEWTGELLVEDLKTSATELGIRFGEFYDETKQALRTPGGLENFTYEVEDHKFTWSKKEKFKVVYGEVLLQSTHNLRDSLILDSIVVINKLKSKYEKLRIEYQKQNIEFETYIESFKNCLEKKNLVEKNLLTKFSTVLNSKKDKIAELQQLLTEKSSILPEAGVGENIRGERELNQHDEIITQERVSSERKGLLLPKRRKLIEESSRNAVALEDSGKNLAYSSADTNNTEGNEYDTDDIFKNL